jgi:predicted  nucleic acid-binding Zn-ribbon protein
MVAEWIQDLLILQDRDQRCDNIERQLAIIPLEVKKDEASIAELKAALLSREEELKAMEGLRMAKEGEIEDAEAVLLKYKTQQMQVKKNEEYAALETEITNLQERISSFEDEELQLMEDLDAGAKALAEFKKETEDQINTYELHIQRLGASREGFQSELAEAQAAVKAAEEGIQPDVLEQYRYVKGQVKRPPVVVALEQSRCQGCHLKVSADVESTARRGNELVRCDSCGRILYWDR